MGMSERTSENALLRSERTSKRINKRLLLYLFGRKNNFPQKFKGSIQPKIPNKNCLTRRIHWDGLHFCWSPIWAMFLKLRGKNGPTKIDSSIPMDASQPEIFVGGLRLIVAPLVVPEIYFLCSSCGLPTQLHLSNTALSSNTVSPENKSRNITHLRYIGLIFTTYELTMYSTILDRQ